MEDSLIRECKESDKSDLIELFFEFGRYLEKLDKECLNLVTVPEDYGQKFYNKMIDEVKTKKGKIFVLENNQKLVGFIAGVIIEVGSNDDELDCKPHRMGRVIELFINEKYRGIGYGSILKSLVRIRKHTSIIRNLAFRIGVLI